MMNIKFFENINENDNVGGKGLSLVKMYKNKFNVPNGYIIMSDVFDNFLKENNVKNQIQKIIDNCDINSEENLERSSKEILEIICKCDISESIKKNIINYYKELNCRYVAIRSSATSEDGKNHAWAGQLETYLNIDENNIIDSVKKCYSSVFSPRAIFYRIRNNDKSDIKVAVIVQEMIQSEISGIAFSINPTTNNKNEIIIEGGFGLGEAVVSGKVTPDTYVISKNENKIKSKQIKEQKFKMSKDKGITKCLNGNTQKLNDGMILKVSEVVKKIEKFYNFPVDIEWAVYKENIYILQCRPITTENKNDLIDKIVSAGNWNFYVSRKFNWFVENTEIYSTLEEYQKNLLGFEVITKNYLCLNGDEYALDKDFDELCFKFNNYFENDVNFFQKFANIEFDLTDKIKNYIKYLENKELRNLSFKELKNEFEKFNDLYIKSFIPGMTRPDEYLLDCLQKELINLKFNEEDIENIISKISTCPNYFELSYSEEHLSLLKIALKIKNGEDVQDLIDKHILKYSWIKGPVNFENTCFTKEDYLSRLENLINTDIEKKIENINKVRENNDIEYNKILEKYKFTIKVRNLIKAIRDFIFLRTYTTEYSDHLFYVGRNTIFKEISNRTSIEEQDLIMLGCKEISSILENKGIMDKDTKKILETRKIGFAMIWIDGEVQTVFGDKSIEIQNKIADIYKTLDIKKETKKVISGSIANTGKVIGIARVLNEYKDIYKVKKGDIIVATMTTPDYVSAMEKASGFITDEGGITCHAAILSREFDVPCIVGILNATKEIKDGQKIELDAYNGKVNILN